MELTTSYKNHMNKRQKLIPLNKLNLTDRFLFEEVMEDPLAHQEALGIILGRDVPLLTLNEAEKELRISPEARSVRLDIFSMDEDRAVYNTEMQKQRRADLSRRSRYYQSLVDISLLDPGIDYSQLNESYLIMITPFDLFGWGSTGTPSGPCARKSRDASSKTGRPGSS